MTTYPRNVFIVMSTRALPYAHLCISTMLKNTIEPIALKVVVDSFAEKKQMENESTRVQVGDGSSLTIVAKEEVTEVIKTRFPSIPGLLQLHEGHPCWRKITDPLALSELDAEFVVADPDLFFPNRFAFEKTPRSGVMMMRQNANCLLPPNAVRKMFDAGVRLANHVDIGVAQVASSSLDLDWVGWLGEQLAIEEFRPYMHIEAIIWSAIAMRIGGEHLDPKKWRCWQRGHIKRVAIAAGFPGTWTLRLEGLPSVKCIHVSGPSKWWVNKAIEANIVREYGNDCTQPSIGMPYIELTKDSYEREQKLKQFASKLGYQKLTNFKQQ